MPDEASGSRCTRREAVVSAVGCCLITVGVAFIASDFFRSYFITRLEQKLVLRPNSSVLDEWVRPTRTDYIKFYVFNVTNAASILRGEKPVLTEHGPYTYRMLLKRFDIAFFSNNTVSFRNRHTLRFEPSMSAGLEDDVYHHVNVQLLSMYQKKLNSRRDFAWEGSKRLIVRHVIKEIIFGYEKPMQYVSSGVLRSISGSGPFHNFNDSDDGLFLVNTGKDDFGSLNMIQRWNGRTHLSYWSTEYANMINGTYGWFVKPFARKTEPRFIYVPLMRRSVKLEYEEAFRTDGIDAYCFHFADDLLANATAAPGNAGFCVPEMNCTETGILYLGTYEENAAPFFVSLPHFYNGDKCYQDVIGLNPNKSEHDSFLIIEPTTGAVIRSRLRLQINVHIQRENLPAQMEAVLPAYVPLFWLSDEANIGNSTHDVTYHPLYLIAVTTLVTGLVVLLGASILIWAAIKHARRRCRCVPGVLYHISDHEERPMIDDVGDEIAELE